MDQVRKKNSAEFGCKISFRPPIKLFMFQTLFLNHEPNKMQADQKIFFIRFSRINTCQKCGVCANISVVQPAIKWLAYR